MQTSCRMRIFDDRYNQAEKFSGATKYAGRGGGRLATQWGLSAIAIASYGRLSGPSQVAASGSSCYKGEMLPPEPMLRTGEGHHPSAGIDGAVFGVPLSYHSDSPSHRAPTTMCSLNIRCLGMVLSPWLLLWGMNLAVDAAESQVNSVALLPSRVELSSPEARQLVIVERRRDERYLGQVQDDIEWSVADSQIARVENGVVVPLLDGETTVTATVAAGPLAGHSATAVVVVRGMGEPFEWNFRNHVETVLTKAGCNMGACHGALAGKKGFKLSLRAYDPDRDYLTLTRQSLGRRIVPDDPGRSLILTKPTGAIPHAGGVRFQTDSLEYRILAEWIAAGTPAPSPNDPQLSHIEILPADVVLEPDARQQMLVLARYDDGHVEDVTRWAKYTAADAAVAEVDDAGLVKVMGHGAGAVSAWFGSQVAIAAVTVPFANKTPAEVYAGSPQHNFIDELVLEKLQQLNIPPSPQASDGEFVRRAYLDTLGMLPTIEETRAFLADGSADKRQRLIDALLARPEFVDYWSYKWSDLLLVNSEKLPGAAMWSFHHWIRNQVAANTPWDQFVRQIVTARGSTLENGAANYFAMHEEPLDLAETTAVAFLGMSINCARCHNHPMEKWTNSQYYAFANLFARVKNKNAPGEGNVIVFAASDGDLIQPASGRAQPPAPLDGEPMAIDDPGDRREVLADWLVSPENPYFSRAIVNRVWSNFMGVGLVEAIDDLRLTNPASNDKLHRALATYLAEQGFDLKQLMRVILQSAAYQRSSEPLPENVADSRFYSRYYPKRLMAEVLLDSFAQVTAARTDFAGYPAGWKALQLPDANVASYFLKTFGRPDRVITCECERTAEPSMVQVLHISNGDSLNEKLQSAGNRIELQLSQGASNEQILEELYLSALARLPTAAERARLLQQLDETPDAERRQAIEDLYWSVLSSKEFLFNH